MDLVRAILLEIERHELTGATFAVDVPDHSAEEVDFHLTLLNEPDAAQHGLATPRCRTSSRIRLTLLQATLSQPGLGVTR